MGRSVTCPKCGFSAEVTRIKIYNERAVGEKIKTIEEGKLKESDENLIKDINKVDKDAEYNSKIERIKELKNRIEW